MSDNDEKRQFCREQAAFSVVYRIKSPHSIVMEYGESEHTATASNLSEEGLCLFTDFELPVGAVLIVTFRLTNFTGSSPEERSRKMELEAEVRHASHAIVRAAFLVGVNFMHLSASDRAFIVGSIAS